MDVVKMSWYQFFCVFLLLLLFTCHCIVVFHDMSSFSRWYITTLLFSISFSLIFILLHNTLLMSVIPTSCSFVIILFCSLLYCSYVFFHVHKTTSTNLVSSKFVHVTSFYIFVSVYVFYEVCACH